MSREVPGAAAPVVDALALVSSSDLRRFLGEQRWFAGKDAGDAGDAAPTIAAPIVLPWGDGHLAIARVSVTVRGGSHIYQVPLAIRSALPAGVPRSALLATQLIDASGMLFDAAHDPEFRNGLAVAISRGASAVATDGATWTVEPRVGRLSVDRSAANDECRPRATRLGSTEQSNTSIVVNEETVIKLFRRPTPGEHPDAEVADFLTRHARFGNTPALRATMHIAQDGTVITTGIATTYLPGSMDAWSYALERSAPYFAPPPGTEAANAFLPDAQRLGAVTRRMHDALSAHDDDEAFAPEAATPRDLERWVGATRAALGDALGLLDEQLRAKRIVHARAAEAKALLGRRDQYLAWIDGTANDVGRDLGMRARVHGDYHLGQVLRTADDDFMIIDFEGEPSKPLDERRAKTSPLRDVAGMLRSIDYAAATLAASVEGRIDAPTREIRAGRWERDVRASYLAGYFGETSGVARRLLPDTSADVQRLIAIFEAEKAFYELAYELNHRPAWAWIPMRGIAKLLAR